MARTVSSRRRAAAWVALASFVLAFVAVALVLVHNLGAVLVGLLGLAVAVAGAWWAAAEVGLRRALGVAATVVGLAVIVGAVVAATDGVAQVVARVAVIAVVLAVASVSMRVALTRDLPAPELRARSTGRPRHAVLLCNPWSGGGKVEQFGLVERARELGVEPVLLDHGLDLEQLAREAVARGADCLGMAGGDGSQALVASIAVEHDLPFVCISAGTRNHFALDLGLNRDDPRETMVAFHDAVERRIDFATAGDRFFVNNVSLGVYATIVQSDDYRDAKVDTTVAALPELLGRQAEPFDLQFTTPGGDEIEGSFLIQVSNNPYVIGASFEAAQRRRLDTGQLGIVAVSAQTGAEAAQLLTMTAVGQRQRSSFWHEFTAAEFEVRSRSGKAYAGIDGEALEVDTPLRFRIHPRGLRLLVPADNLAEAERRRSRDRDLRGLLDLAAGRDPDATD